jgi:hypothetical protein
MSFMRQPSQGCESGRAVGRVCAGGRHPALAAESPRRGELFAALVEGPSARQSDAEYKARLDASIQNIFGASNT